MPPMFCVMGYPPEGASVVDDACVNTIGVAPAVPAIQSPNITFQAHTRVIVIRTLQWSQYQYQEKDYVAEVGRPKEIALDQPREMLEVCVGSPA